MSQKIAIAKLLPRLVAIGLVSATVACAHDGTLFGAGDPPARATPLPVDAQDANQANPAGPNCYPDVYHCASYPSGESVKDNAYQYESPAQINSYKTPK